jgi:hypothetical protein
MLDALGAVGLIVILGAGVIFFMASGSARAQIEQVAPEYASRLYLSTGESFISRSPVSWIVLFGERVPDAARSWVAPIRLFGAVFLAGAVALAAYFLWSLR